jgi:hypothetical protein
MLIITVSHDKESLNRRISSFERAGNVVLPASSLLTCLSMIEHNSYDLLVIGATVPLSARRKIVSASKRLHPESKIISVEQKNSRSLVAADCVVEAGDEVQLLNAIAMFSSKVGIGRK